MKEGGNLGQKVRRKRIAFHLSTIIFDSPALKPTSPKRVLRKIAAPHDHSPASRAGEPSETKTMATFPHSESVFSSPIDSLIFIDSLKPKRAGNRNRVTHLFVIVTACVFEGLPVAGIKLNRHPTNASGQAPRNATHGGPPIPLAGDEAMLRSRILLARCQTVWSQPESRSSQKQRSNQAPTPLRQSALDTIVAHAPLGLL